MQLRNLKPADATLMLEWMHDPTVVEFLGTNFAEKTINDCKNFIQKSLDDQHNLNLAIVDENDEYMGTVSLKHIDKASSTAEFAITVRKCAMGKGYSQFGMKEILNIGLSKIGVSNIYWCVSQKNLRAVKFYDKCGYQRVATVPENISKFYENISDFIWYVYN